MKLTDPYVLLSGKEVSLEGFSSRDRTYLEKLAAATRKRGVDYFDLLREVTGIGAYPLQGGKLTPEVVLSAVYRIARDIVDRLGVEQAVVLAPGVDTSTAPTVREIPDLVSLSEAAAILGMSRPSVHQALKEGRLAGIQVGNAWVMRKADVEGFKKKRGRSSPREKTGSKESPRGTLRY